MTRTATSGSWKPGQCGNPKGRPKRGLQSFKDRLVFWLETKTIGELQAIVDHPKKWSTLLTVDALVVRRIHAACEVDGTGDFIAVLDRLLGKPTMTAELNVVHGLAERLDKAEAILLENTSSNHG